MTINRRDFVKYSIGGMAALAMGTGLTRIFVNDAIAIPVPQTLNITITDAVKGMVTDNAINPAKCYFWIYKVTADGVDIPADAPGPIIIAVAGSRITLNITNNLDEPHNFAIPGAGIVSPILEPGAANVPFTFTMPPAGPYLYYDSLNAPVNRVMGLHGALISMPDPDVPITGHKFTPYANPTPGVQALYDDFGSTPQWPGLSWQQGDANPATFAPAFRQYVWLLHQASPKLFEEVGSLPPGVLADPVAFENAFLRDTFSADNFNIATRNRTPQYFTINGQSGHFSHNNPFICPNLRAGEPCVVHLMNAGLMSHSKHLHANHFFVTYQKKGVPVNNGVPVNTSGVAINPIFIDVFTMDPLDVTDYTVPYMRPPDVGTVRGIGMPDTPLTSIRGLPVWPPEEEMALSIGQPGFLVQLSPLCYPMHDHSEPSQTAQGGNYNLGTISGMNFTGDRTLGPVRTFAHAPTSFGPNKTGPAAGPEV